MQQRVDDKKSPCKYKLTYFNLRGRGELPRLIFAAAGIPFEDKRVQFGKEWEEYKPKTPHGYMPVLEVDGCTLDQSQTIARYLSREFGLHGDSNWQMALVETCMDLCLDIFLQVVKLHFEKDEEKKKNLFEEMQSKNLPNFMTFMERIINDNGNTGYLVGSKLTTGDLAFYEIMTLLMTMFKDQNLGEKYPKLGAHFKLIGDLPKIKKYVAERPDTEG